MSFLLDTNVVSEILKPKPNPYVAAWIRRQDRLVLASITVEEIYYGLTHKDAHKRRAWFERFLEFHAEILGTDLDIARQAGVMRGNFRREGRTRSQADMLIAATAHLHSLTLATRNTKDFEGCDIEVFNPFQE